MKSYDIEKDKVITHIQSLSRWNNENSNYVIEECLAREIVLSMFDRMWRMSQKLEQIKELQSGR